MRQFQEHWYKPLYNDWDIVLTCGSMEGCSKVLEMVLENGDPMMAQVPTYDGVLGVVNSSVSFFFFFFLTMYFNS